MIHTSDDPIECVHQFDKLGWRATEIKSIDRYWLFVFDFETMNDKAI
jgi:hypothetical protein